jgi:hypothetical protein
MNDPLVITAIRKLPPQYAAPGRGLDVTRFGDSGVVAAHPTLPALIFVGGKWRVLTTRLGGKRK